MKALSLISLLLLLYTQCAFSQLTPEKGKALEGITTDGIMSDIEFLSSDLLEGREAGKRGAGIAALYIASRFKQLGLQPFHSNSEPNNTTEHYLQKVPLIWSKVEEATLAVKKGEQSFRFTSQTDFSPAATNYSFNANGNVVFAGYGIEETTNGGFKNKILLRAKGYPGMGDTLSNGHQKYNSLTERELANIKNNFAREAGASVILEFDPENPTFHLPADNDQKDYAEKELSKRSSGIYKRAVRRSGTELGNTPPIFKVSHRVVEALFPEWQKELSKYTTIAKKKRKFPTSTSGIEVAVQVEETPFMCSNVIGKIEGKNKDEIIVIGAHYDHLGIYDGFIYNGADDNASGVAGVIALAKAFAESETIPEKTLIFAAWTAEERGLHGSTHFVHTFKDLNKIKYYHNYDMIGRSSNPEKPDSAVSFLYTKSWEQAKNLTDKNNTEANLNLNIRWGAMEDPTGGSDNAPFAEKVIPIMWFHTGGHPDYHGPYDHAEKIDQSKIVKIVKLSFLNIWDLTNRINQ